MKNIVFDPKAFKQFNEWAIEDKKLYKKIVNLIDDILRHPFYCLKKEKTAMSQAEITDSLLTSRGFYSLFQTLPLEIRQGFLQLLFQNNSSELEDFILYLACDNSRKEGFLSELESQSLLESLPQ